MKNLLVLDCEVYPNYFLVAFKNVKNGKTLTIEVRGEENFISDDDLKKLRTILLTKVTFGFNSRNYDMPILMYVLDRATCSDIHRMSDFIINNGKAGWQTLDHFGLYIPREINHFDIQEPSPAVKVSLKLYGARMHCKKLQDLPIEPGTVLTDDEMQAIKKYCINDLDTTIELYKNIEDRIKLRIEMSSQYGGIDLRSKSDAQIAEQVIRYKLENEHGVHKPKAPTINKDRTYKYNVPDFISFKTGNLNKVFDTIKNVEFALDAKGSIKLPAELSRKYISIGAAKYKIGVGGLHSNEKRQCVELRENQILADRDVTSYYPAVILNQGLFPRHLGEGFLKVYQDIVDTRVKAKREGDKLVDSSLKIVINGSFGKFGNKYSILYSPDLLLQVTLTGQLSLLMLIEELELNGINVVSANTDGFVSLMSKDDYKLYDTICNNWEITTGFNLEETQYKALYSRDVNNYLAVTSKDAKGKGIFAEESITKSPSGSIVIEAVKNLLVYGRSIYDTIYSCQDITKFIHARTVTGGGTWKGEYLGKVVRWIYVKGGCEILYKKPNKSGTHPKVPRSDGSTPIMDIDDNFPKDLDYARYVEDARGVLDDLGLLNF